MAVTITHPFVSAIPDDPASVAAGEVVPSDWNAVHTITGLSAVAESGSTTDDLSEGVADKPPDELRGAYLSSNTCGCP